MKGSHAQISQGARIVSGAASEEGFAARHRFAQHRADGGLDRQGNKSMIVYHAVVHKDEDSAWGVHFPDLPGCFSAADELHHRRRAAADGSENVFPPVWPEPPGQSMQDLERFRSNQFTSAQMLLAQEQIRFIWQNDCDRQGRSCIAATLMSTRRAIARSECNISLDACAYWTPLMTSPPKSLRTDIISNAICQLHCVD